MSGPQAACFPAYLAPTSKIELLLHALLPEAGGEAQQTPTLVARSSLTSLRRASDTRPAGTQPQSSTTFSIVRMFRTVELTPTMLLNFSASLLRPRPRE